MDWVISGCVASLLTVFDIGRVFYIPKIGPYKRKFYSWAGIFILANAALSIILYFSFRDISTLHSLNSSLRALIIGASYLVLVRSKLATIKVQSDEIPLGLEYVYNGAKDFVYKGMNRVSIQALTAEAAAMVGNRSLKELALETKAHITNNNLLSENDKNLRKSWLLNVLQDNTSDEEKSVTLATYILDERM
jgi:hypothetical protein